MHYTVLHSTVNCQVNCQYVGLAGFPLSTSDEVEDPLKVIGGIERDRDGSTFHSSDSNFDVGLQVVPKLIFDMANFCARGAQGPFASR